MTTPLWQIFFSTLGGALVGFFLALFATAVRERPRLSVRLHGPRERVYVRPNQPTDGKWSFTVEEPDSAGEVVLTVQLSVLNASAAYDSVTDVTLAVDGQLVPARLRADETFSGVNVPPRQTLSQRVRFFLPKEPTATRDGEPIETPAWLWQPAQPWPAMNLTWTSVRRRLLRRRPVHGEIEISGPWLTAHRPGVTITYMHAQPR